MIEPPLPFGHASARGYYVLFKGLVERGHDVTAFAVCSKPQDLERARAAFPQPQYDLRLFLQPAHGSLSDRLGSIVRPYSRIFPPEMYASLLNERDLGYDVLHLEQIWCGWLGLDFDRSRTVLNIHSLYRIDTKDSKTWSAKARFYRFLQVRGEVSLLRKYAVLSALTPRLQMAAQEAAPKARVGVIPLGIDLSLYPLVPEAVRPRRCIIGVIGSMDWYPSRSAAVRLLKRLLPDIRQQVPEVLVTVVGWNARSALREYVDMPGVNIEENVLDTRPYFEQTSVLLYAPERGSGMKVKIMEAFAYGIPVVTTWEGVEGLPAEDGVHAGVADNDQGLIDRAVALLKDPARQERQRLAARSMLEAHCGPKAILDAFERCYAEMVKSPARVVDR